MKNKKIFLKYITLIFLIALTAFIFLRSLRPGDKSSEESEAVGNVINNMLKIFNINSELGQHFLRKLAHFTEYFALGIATHLTVVQFSLPKVASPLYVILTASADEIIQLFVEGRNGCISDVLLDFCGSACGIVITIFIIYLVSKSKRIKDKTA